MGSKYLVTYNSDTGTRNLCVCDTREDADRAREKYELQAPRSSGVFLISKIPGKYNDGENIIMFENLIFRPELNDDRKIMRTGKLTSEDRLLGRECMSNGDTGLITYRMCSMQDTKPHCELTRQGGTYINKYIDMLLFGVDGDVMSEFKYHAINQLKKRVESEGFDKVWESLPEGGESVVS